MKKFNGVSLLSGMIALCLTALTASAQQTPVPLGSDSTFAVLAATAITVTGGGTINGNIGTSSGTAPTGIPPAVVNGNDYVGGAIAAQAQADLIAAINDAADTTNGVPNNPRKRGPPIVLGPVADIGGKTLPAGLYNASTSLGITGNLTLDGGGHPDAVFIFQIGSTLGVTGQVLLVNGASANNVFWEVGTSATLNTGSGLQGNILANTSITINAGATLTGRALAHTGAVSISSNGGTIGSVPASPGAQFIPVPPCRAIDTRLTPNGFVPGQTTKSFTIQGNSCGIPSTALAYSFNVAVVPRAAFAYLTMWPTGQTQPYSSTLNSDGRRKSNAAIVPAGTGGAVSVFVSHDADVVLDINGYFVPAGTPGALAFYPLPPCRVSDTRNPNGPYGGPFVMGQTSRTIPVAGACGVPAGAQAYSLNLAAVPHGPLGFLTAWATGSPQPYVASLNDSTGTVAANAAIVPAAPTGSISPGSVDVFATNDADLIVDINGYFAPPGGAGALSLYTLLTSCRALDSRLPSGASPFTGALLNIGIASSACAVSTTAQAYVLNAVAIPPGPLGYLTLWAQNAAQPAVASINASDAAVTSNMAIVGTSNGSISAFASNSTYLVLDIFGYFAP